MPYNILVVDDDDSFRSTLKEYLYEYEFQEAAGSRQALSLLQAPHDIDLVLLDVMLPDKRGTEVLKDIKRIDSNVGIIIFTGYSSEDVAIEALRGRADEYLDKAKDIHRLREAISRVMESKEREKYSTTGMAGQIDRVKRFIEKNYHKKVKLEDAAQKICVSPKYLSRLFKSHTGVTFNQYRLKIKVEKAKELLSKTAYNINQISEQMGYLNSESFIRVFLKTVGVTPTAYRKKSLSSGKERR